MDECDEIAFSWNGASRESEPREASRRPAPFQSPAARRSGSRSRSSRCDERHRDANRQKHLRPGAKAHLTAPQSGNWARCWSAPSKTCVVDVASYAATARDARPCLTTMCVSRARRPRRRHEGVSAGREAWGNPSRFEVCNLASIVVAALPPRAVGRRRLRSVRRSAARLPSHHGAFRAQFSHVGRAFVAPVPQGCNSPRPNESLA